jgi:hypothetical protein
MEADQVEALNQDRRPRVWSEVARGEREPRSRGGTGSCKSDGGCGKERLRHQGFACDLDIRTRELCSCVRLK